MPRLPPPFWKTLLPLAISLPLFLLVCVAIDNHVLIGLNDFLAFYSGGKLAFTSDLYNPTAIYEVQAVSAGLHAPSLLFIRLPFYAGLLYPLSLLPYRIAYLVFLAINVGAIALFAWLLRREAPAAACLAAVCFPLLLAIGNWQDVPLLLAVLAGVWRLLEARRDFAAGALLALGLIKPHLTVPLALALLVCGRRRAAAGWLGGAMVLGLACIPVAGWDWMERLAEVLALPKVHQDLGQMGSLQASLRLQFGSLPVAAGLLAAVLALAPVFLTLARLRDIRLAFTLALPAALLAGDHVYLQDFALLLPAALLLGPELHSSPGGWAMKWLLCPVPYICLLARAWTQPLLPLSLAVFLLFVISKHTPAAFAILKIHAFRARSSAG